MIQFLKEIKFIRSLSLEINYHAQNKGIYLKATLLLVAQNEKLNWQKLLVSNEAIKVKGFFRKMYSDYIVKDIYLRKINVACFKVFTFDKRLFEFFKKHFVVCFTTK